jgi:hypothetical protein
MEPATRAWIAAWPITRVTWQPVAELDPAPRYRPRSRAAYQSLRFGRFTGLPLVLALGNAFTTAKPARITRRDLPAPYEINSTRNRL